MPWILTRTPVARFLEANKRENLLAFYGRPAFTSLKAALIEK
jgi:hypothetical protein